MNKILLKKKYIYDGNLILVNKEHKLNRKIKLSRLDYFKDKILLDNNVSLMLHNLLNYINSKNEIVLVSGYRTFKEQETIYNTSINENGEEFTNKYVAFPNCSEHQTGLAIDLALNEGNIDFICPSFPYYGICQKFRDIAPLYGFIERYKKDKEMITNISKEEWHFRYVGYPHSKIITTNNFSLEEYIEYLKQFVFPSNPLKYDKYKIFYIPYKDEFTNIEIENNFSISGNNIDGFILTVEGV